MGSSYSQPPRGYLYSNLKFQSGTNGKKIIIRENPDYQPDIYQFETFQSLYLNKFQSEQNITYLQEFGNKFNLTYGNVFQLLMAAYHQLKISYQPDTTIAIYANPSTEVMLLFDTLLFAGIRIFPFSPFLKDSETRNENLEKFADLCKRFNVSMIYCNPGMEKSIKQLLPNLIVFPINQNIFHSSATTEFPPVDPTTEAFIYESGTVISQSDLFRGLTAWSKRLSLCRDAIIHNSTEINSGTFRLIIILGIFNRSTYSFIFSDQNDFQNYSAKEAQRAEFLNADTHTFLSPNQFGQLEEIANEAFNEQTMIKRVFYTPASSIAKFGSFSGANKIFNKNIKLIKFMKDNLISEESNFFFVDGKIPSDAHEKVSLFIKKPISVIFSPPEWVNEGTALPTLIQFTKFGTVGGPVISEFEWNQEEGTIKVVGRNLEIKGSFDEEGSVIIA